ncbi:MAG TPA: MarR family transcriptional regulator [Candidatus Angelobacter sp.]|nr:MarR family transcriptional regulator [Candidatus Angelobacter sp.]
MSSYERFQGWIMKVHVPHFLELNLTLAQLRTLYLVTAAGPMRMSEVADRLGTAPSTTTGVVDGLVALGLLERGEDAGDRRHVVVRTTHAARERLEDFHELGRGRLRELLERFESREALAEVEHAIDLLTDAAMRLNEDTAP